MNAIAKPKRGNGAIAKFDPAQAKERLAKADAVIQYATAVKDWPLLADAIDQKLEELDELRRWWREEIARAGGNGSNQHSRAKNADRG